MNFNNIHKRKDQSSYTERAVDWLVIGALVFGVATLLMEGQILASFAYSDIDDIWTKAERSPAFKLLKVLEVFCVLSAGILAFWTEGRFCVKRSVKWMLLAVLLWMTGHALITFSGGFTPYELLNQKGPVVWWSLLFLFAGFSKSRWERIYPIVKAIVVIGSIEMAYRIFSLSGHFDRTAAQRTLRMSLRLMLWSAPLMFLVSHKNAIWRFVSISSFFLIAAASLMTGTRSWLLVCLVYFGFIVYSAVRRARKIVAKILVIYLTFAALSLACIVGFLIFEPQIVAGMDVLFSRLTLDSRTGQLIQFFNNVPFVDFLVGTGPRGTWQWRGVDYGYVDGVYFFMLFLGGVPLLISYLYLVVFPPVRCLFKKGILQFGTIDFACITMGVIWGVVLSGLSTYTMPEVKIHHYIVLLCVGRCWGILLESSGGIYKGQGLKFKQF